MKIKEKQSKSLQSFVLKIREIPNIFCEGCEIENEFPRILIFNISKKNMKLSKIFVEMEKLKCVKGKDEIE
jgi:hypothetical protein